MKKLIIFTAMIITTNVLSATTATLNLMGRIEEELSIEVIDDSGAQSLDLTQSAVNRYVGKTRINSNSANGYNVKVSSANGWRLTNQSDATAGVDYTLRYDGDNLQTTPGEQTIDGGNSPVRNKDQNLEVSYIIDPAVQLKAGDYTDTVSFTIEAK